MGMPNMIEKTILEAARKNGGNGPKPIIPGALSYYKWLSYVPDFLQEYISDISNKKIKELSLKEFNDYKNFLEEQKIVKELEQYFKEEWALADFYKIKGYISSHSLSKIKRSRLTEEEYKRIIEAIHKTIGNYSEIYIDMVSNDFTGWNFTMSADEKEKYINYSMEEAFIFDFVNKLKIKESIEALNEDCLGAFKRNEKKRR